MGNETLADRTANATRWSTITEIVAKLISPITNMILARLLTPEIFGVIATITMIISFADMFTDAGFQKYLIQHDFKDDTELNRSTTVAFWSNLFISIVLWILIAIFSENIASMVGNDGLGIVIVIAASSLPLTSFSSIQMARYKRSFDFKTLFYVRVISAFVPLFVTVPFAYMTKSYWSLVIGTIAGNLVNAVVLTIRSPWKPTFFYDFRMLKKMFSFSGWILLESISVWLTSYIDTFIVGAFLSDYYLGLYKTSMTTANQIIGLITAATSAPLFTALSKLQNEDYEFKNFYYRYIQAISVLLVPLGFGMFHYRNLITAVLLGNQWEEAARFIGLWSLSSAFCLVFGTYCSAIYNAKGKPLFSVIVQLLHLIVLIPVLVIGSKIGYDTLCTMRSLVRFELVLVQLLFAHFFFNISIIRLVKATIPVFLCTGIMSIFAVFFVSISNNYYWQFFSIMLCVFAYFTSMHFLFNGLAFESFSALGFDIKSILSKVRRK